MFLPILYGRIYFINKAFFEIICYLCTLITILLSAMEGKKLFKAFLMGLAFLIGYLFILVSEYGLFTGDGSPLATMMPWVFVLGMLFYSTFHSKKMKYVFGIGAFIFISLVLQVLYGGNIYAKYLIYTSKMNLPETLKSYHYLNNKPLQIGKKHIIPTSVKGNIG